MATRPMPIINEDGKYVYVENTRMVQTSSHPVYRARIEVALGQGDWIGAPKKGHQLDRFKRARRSDHSLEAFQKGLTAYLDPYTPDVIDVLVEQGGVQMDLTIKQGALDVVV